MRGRPGRNFAGGTPDVIVSDVGPSQPNYRGRADAAFFRHLAQPAGAGT